MIGRSGDVGLVLWHGDPTLAANRWLLGHIVSARRAGHPYRIGLQLIAEQAPLPDAETRRFVQAMFKEELPHIHRFINAPLGDSMKQSLVRTVLRGMAMISDKSRAVVIASTLEEALDMASAVASAETPPRSVLRRTVDEMFALAALQPR